MTNDRSIDTFSPAIQLIMIIIVVVILAAVVTAFIFGVASTSEEEKEKDVKLTISLRTTNIPGNYIPEVFWQGGSDIKKITSWEASINSGDNYIAGSPSIPTEGVICPLSTITVPTKILIRAKFNDNTSKVIFEKQY
ncbi:MAG: hypothetical protein BWY93_00143 [Euryarchaeota archaeon ADurb.BinA087]|nr:MAG: hypothetical protein BWY93_00143 [Euryarchaeota archaeon ADurb.BinA087]